MGVVSYVDHRVPSHPFCWFGFSGSGYHPGSGKLIMSISGVEDKVWFVV